MIVELFHLENLQLYKTSFYTAWVEGRVRSEFDDFQERMKADRKNKRQRDEINRHIQKIGNEDGALDRYFKREGFAERLPPPTYRFFDSDGEDDFGLRLYCLKISEQIVILLNGDRKTAQNPLQCPNCKKHYLFANSLSNAIYYAREKNEIEIEGFDILTDEDFKLDLPNLEL